MGPLAIPRTPIFVLAAMMALRTEVNRMGAAVNVVSMCADHLPQCRSIIATSSFFQRYGTNPDTITRQLEAILGDDQHDLRVGCRATRVLGFSWVIRHGGFGRSPYLKLLAVDEHQHRSGVGTALMTSLESAFSAHRQLLLLVTDTNHHARRFYERLGYQQVGLLADYVQSGVHECIYMKRLGNRTPSEA